MRQRLELYGVQQNDRKSMTLLKVYAKDRGIGHDKCCPVFSLGIDYAFLKDKLFFFLLLLFLAKPCENIDRPVNNSQKPS